jgi:uncharacterized membrane protein
MIRKHKYDVVILLGLFAFSVSLYLSITHYLGFTVPCNVTHGCEVVLTSKYSMLFGLPLAVWGVVFYTGVIFSSLLANHYRLWRKIVTGLLSLGALGSLTFLAIQIFVLHKVCQYCLAVDLTTLILFLWDINIEYYTNQLSLP